MTQDERDEAERAQQSKPQILGPLDLQGPIAIQQTPSLPGRPDLLIVQQVQYGAGSKQLDWNKLPNIYFNHAGREGVSLVDAMDTYFNGPDGRDELVFTCGNVGVAVSCRIIFEGYPSCGRARQITTTRYGGPRERITRKKLAHEVAKCIKAYLEVLKDSGTPYPIRFEDMFLTNFVNVSRASWQPEIWYRPAPSGSGT